MATPRRIEQIVEDQVRKWEISGRRRSPEKPPEPVIAISRLPGCDGAAVGLELSSSLKLDYFDKGILHQVSKSSEMSEALLKTVDEKVLPTMQDWIKSLFLRHDLRGAYFIHLSKVLLAIGEHGRAVVLGRGASFILRPETCLRVLLVAPFEDRARAVAAREGVPYAEARRRVKEREAQRRAFIRQLFHAVMTDAAHYDLTVNLSSVGFQGAVAAIEAAWQARRKQVIASS